eukprot:13626446-Alexandrium_andersonii.AAC.1
MLPCASAHAPHIGPLACAAARRRTASTNYRQSSVSPCAAVRAQKPLIGHLDGVAMRRQAASTNYRERSGSARAAVRARLRRTS